MSVTIQQLEFFRAVARNLSFSAAAKELYTSQPYVSNQIRKLEDHYGVPLFVRSHPRIGLTEAGNLLYQRITRVLDDLDELELLVQQFQGLHRGTIQIASTESAGNHVMPGLIASFNRQYPDVVIQGSVGNTGEVMHWLDLDEVEVGVCPHKPDASNMASEPLYREALVVAFPAGMELPDPLPPARLATLPKVAREKDSLTLTKMRELIEPYSGGADFVAQLDGTTAVNEAVAAGVGVSLVPERSVRAWLQAGTVRTCTIEGTHLHHEYHLVYSHQRYLTPAAQAFIDHVRHAALG